MLAMSRKKRNLLLSIILAFGFLGLNVGCETYENVGGGTMLGAGLGAGIGALAGDAGLGAAIGAGAGLLGGLAKDSMEKSQQSKAYQAQTDAQIRRLAENAEIQRQVNRLQQDGYTADKYTYDASYGINGGIIVRPVERSNLPQIQINR